MLTDKSGCGGLGLAALDSSGYLSRKAAGWSTGTHSKVLLDHVSCWQGGTSRCGRAYLGDHGEGRRTLELRAGGQRSMRSKLCRKRCGGIQTCGRDRFSGGGCWEPCI